MKRTLQFAIALSSMMIAGHSIASDDQHAHHQAAGHDHAAMAPDFAKLDANNDGQLEKSELPKDHPMLGHFDMMDKDKDGKISKAEFDEMHASHDGH